jgi:hypothetical protein
VADNSTERLRTRLTQVEARLRVLTEADDNASWGRPLAARGGFRLEQADLVVDAEQIRAELEGRA